MLRRFARVPTAAFRVPSRSLPARRFLSTLDSSSQSHPPPPPPPRSKGPIFAGVFGLAAGGAALYYFTQLNEAPKVKEAAAPFKPKKEDYQRVYNKVAELFDEAGDYDDGSYAPIILRLAWHSSGTYDAETNTGGSNAGSMRFRPESNHAANNGLAIARDLLDKFKAENAPWMSYGDLWTLAGVAAVQEMGGPHVAWRPGRIDGFEASVTPDGRLPDATQGAAHIRSIFGRMGFNDQEMVALSGAHALGRCHTERSGFDGPWTFSPTTVSNAYYQLLLNEKWQWRKWSGPRQLEDATTKSLMMLPTDYALVEDPKFREYVKKYAADEKLFFEDFSKVIAKLFELGVPTKQFETDPWELKTLAEQKSS